MNQPLTPDDPRLPLVHARLLTLARSLLRAGQLEVDGSGAPAPSPALRLLQPVLARLRRELLAEELLEGLLPEIERQMVSDGTLERNERGLHAEQPVDWPATWRRPAGRPPAVVTRRWERNLGGPENRLAAAALAALSQPVLPPAGWLLSPRELATLDDLRHRALAARRRPPWHQIPAPAGITPALVAQVEARRPRRPACRALAIWARAWLAVPHVRPGARPLPAPALEPDTLFELLVLLELIEGLARHLPVRQCRPLSGAAGEPIFRARAPQGDLLIFVQSGAPLAAGRSLADIRAIPDIVIQLPCAPARYILVDAKNYGPSNHAQAVYKMLGYLYQYGYDGAGPHHFDRILGGVLLFSTDEREGHGLRHWHDPAPGTQAVLSGVLPPVPDDAYRGMAALVEWIVDATND